jgi:hypothetical protein
MAYDRRNGTARGQSKYPTPYEQHVLTPRSHSSQTSQTSQSLRYSNSSSESGYRSNPKAFPNYPYGSSHLPVPPATYLVSDGNCDELTQQFWRQYPQPPQKTWTSPSTGLSEMPTVRVATNQLTDNSYVQQPMQGAESHPQYVGCLFSASPAGSSCSNYSYGGDSTPGSTSSSYTIYSKKSASTAASTPNSAYTTSRSSNHQSESNRVPMTSGTKNADPRYKGQLTLHQYVQPTPRYLKQIREIIWAT